MIASRMILSIKKVLPSGVLELEGHDEQTWKDHFQNCAPYHLPNIHGTMDPILNVISASLKCMLCDRN